MTGANVKPHLWLIQFIGLIVPRRLRADWRQEWEAELQYREMLLADWDKINWKTKLDLVRRSLGAFWDALVLQPQRMEDEMFQDLRFGSRMLLKTPGFTLIAIFTIALGIGANTAIFSVVNTVLLRPLPYLNADRIVAIQEISKEGKRIQVTPANFLDWRAQNTVFEHLSAIFTRTANLAGENEAERITLAVTSADFFDVFGAQPHQGRLFLPEDEKAGHDPIVVISHALWQRRYGGDPDIVGKPITLDGITYTVAGVAPAGFQYPDKTEAWLPPVRLAPAVTPTMDVTQVRGFGFLSAVALLKPGVPLQQAKDEMETITARLREQYPETNNNRFNRVVSLHTHLVGDTSLVLLLLLGAVCFVLLIACANVANLMLVRATARQKEIAIRTALGASRLRIVRQLLTESVMLAVTGGAFGLLLAWQGIHLLTRLLPKDFPRHQDIGVDLKVLGFTILVSVLTGIVFGFAPAWQVSRADTNESLKENARGAAGGTRNRLRGLFVIGEVALSLVLLVGAGLLFRSFLQLQSVTSGFDSHNVLTFRLSPSGTNFRQDPQFIAYYTQVEERLRSIPGVETVGAINTLPLSKGPTLGFRIEGREPLPVDKWPHANYRCVSTDYFRALSIPVDRGRAFAETDGVDNPLVALINQAAAADYFAGEDPVGRRIGFGGTDRKNQPVWFEIVGVVANVRTIELQEEPMPEVYLSSLQDTFSGMSFVIRTQIDPAGLAAAAREAAQDVDRGQPVADLRTMDNIVSESITQPRFNLTLLGIFAGIALILSAAGIYGVTSYTVAQRTHELGIRVALGARQSDIFKLVVGQGMMLALIGIGIGLAATSVLTQLLTSLLFGVSPSDPLTFATITFLLGGVAVFACYLPARRAARVDPMTALRSE
ncbi:MAG: ABC transporter permease [Blastocatellia bacterium]